MVAPPIYREIARCRLCGADVLDEIISLGDQTLGGRFPRDGEPDPPRAPLDVLRCAGCGFVQLRHSVETGELFTQDYGYRSGINQTMREHLRGVVVDVESRIELGTGDIVLDIGCNDGTMLACYSGDVVRVGIDPLAGRFDGCYPDGMLSVADFFSARAFRNVVDAGKARVVTSIAIFYDLEDPNAFIADIAEILDEGGLWVLELSYMPRMLARNSYDTVCHEHLGYYALEQIEFLMRGHGLRVFDVGFSDINGGSFRIFVCHEDAGWPGNMERLDAVRGQERAADYPSLTPFRRFRAACERQRDELHGLVRRETEAGKEFYLYGASTKGNTILQYAELDHTLIVAAADRNSEKWGARTPCTGIPIISEQTARAARPDYFLVLPWSFRDEFLKREATFRKQGGKLVFPLPAIEIV